MFQERLVNEHGKFAESYTEERGIVKQYFAGLLKGTHEKLRDLLQDMRNMEVTTAAGNANVVRHLESVPSIQVITRSHAAVDPSNAFGELCVGPEVNKCFSTSIARLLHPVHVKSCILSLDRSSKEEVCYKNFGR